MTLVFADVTKTHQSQASRASDSSHSSLYVPPQALCFVETRPINFSLSLHARSSEFNRARMSVQTDKGVTVRRCIRTRRGKQDELVGVYDAAAGVFRFNHFGICVTSCAAWKTKRFSSFNTQNTGILSLCLTLTRASDGVEKSALVMPCWVFSNFPENGDRTLSSVSMLRDSILQCNPPPVYHEIIRKPIDHETQSTNHNRGTLTVRYHCNFGDDMTPPFQSLPLSNSPPSLRRPLFQSSEGEIPKMVDTIFLDQRLFGCEDFNVENVMYSDSLDPRATSGLPPEMPAQLTVTNYMSTKPPADFEPSPTSAPDTAQPVPGPIQDYSQFTTRVGFDKYVPSPITSTMPETADTHTAPEGEDIFDHCPFSINGQFFFL